MKWSVSVGLRLTIDYDDIEAETQEEAEEIAIEKALEDIDYNNASCDESDIIVYAAWPASEEEDLTDVD
jgi:hypothetical protein